ncbi:hypothetical protein SDC9_117395 [bioreactor metagenome]|uniref:Uncharacterized protein n=1 Tax=bioreactor metagenome TaxID=1076179 RepID=A0A645BY62_9ZZZZ
MLNFRAADSESHRSESAMRSRMRISADDNLSWLGCAQFRSDHVHDSLVGCADVHQRDVEFCAILLQRFNLFLRNKVFDVEDIFRRHIVVDRCDRFIWASDLAVGFTQAVEALR